MLAFGRDEMLQRDRGRQRRRPTSSRCPIPTAATQSPAATLDAGKAVFAANCAACHGEDGKGNREVGAPEPDRQRSGSTAATPQSIYRRPSGTAGRARCRAWESRLSAARAQDPRALRPRPRGRSSHDRRACTHAAGRGRSRSGCWSARPAAARRAPTRISSTSRSRRSRTASPTSGRAKATAQQPFRAAKSSCSPRRSVGHGARPTMTDDPGGRAAAAARAKTWHRNLPPSTAFAWLAAGWRDLLDAARRRASLYGARRLPGLGRHRRRPRSRSAGTTSCSRPSPASWSSGRSLAIGLYEKSRAHRGRRAGRACAA